MRSLDNPNVGTLILHGNSRVGSGTTISASSLLAPKNAIKAYERGMESLRKGDQDSAQKNFQKAITIYPKYATAWFELGRLEMPSDRGAARSFFENAIAADDKYVLPYTQLALINALQRDWAATRDITERAIGLDRVNFPQIFFFNAVAQYNLHHLTDAESRVREAIKIDPQHQIPRTHQLLSTILEAKGDLAGAAEQLRAYIEISPNQAEIEKSRQQLAKLESRLDSAPSK